MSDTPNELLPLFSNADLEKLARGIKGLTKDEQFSVYERLVAVRGYYERNRAELYTALDMRQNCGDCGGSGTRWTDVNGEPEPDACDCWDHAHDVLTRTRQKITFFDEVATT